MTIEKLDKLNQLPAGITFNGYRLSDDFTLERISELYEYRYGRKPVRAFQFGNSVFVEVTT